MKPVVQRVTAPQEASQSLHNPDMRFTPEYLAHNGKECYEGFDYTYNGHTGQVDWTTEDKKSKLKEGNLVAFHY